MCLGLCNLPNNSQRSCLVSLFIDKKTEALRDYLTELVGDELELKPILLVHIFFFFHYSNKCSSRSLQLTS